MSFFQSGFVSSYLSALSFLKLLFNLLQKAKILKKYSEKVQLNKKKVKTIQRRAFRERNSRQVYFYLALKNSIVKHFKLQKN